MAGRPAGPRAGRRGQELIEQLRSRKKAGASTVSLVPAETLIGRKLLICLFLKAVLFVVVLQTRKMRLKEG